MWKRTQKTPPPPVPPRLFPILRHGAVEIHGTFEGTLWAEGDVVVSRTGRVSGGLKGRHVLVQGKVEGQLHSDGTVLIQRRAKVEGSLRAQLVVIEPGAQCRLACAVGDLSTLAPSNPAGEQCQEVEAAALAVESGAKAEAPLIPSTELPSSAQEVEAEDPVLERMVISIDSVQIWKSGGAGGSRFDRDDSGSAPLPRAA